MILFNSRTPDHAWLGNMWPCPVIDKHGTTWRSAEHAYQASKTVRANQRQQIHDAPSPFDAKRLGKHVEVRSDWDAVKLVVMRNIIARKFEQNADLMTSLLDTGDQPLVHLSPWDRYWGVDNDGRGENRLGVLLMEVREGLRQSF